MKRIFLFVIAVLMASVTSSAQLIEDYQGGWPEKHIILQDFNPLAVYHIENWYPEYLTVTELYNYALFTSCPATLKVFSVITEINGQSTKGMEPRTFYDIVAESTEFTLKYITKENGGNRTYSHTLQKYKGYGVIEYWRRNYAFWPKGGVLSDADVDFFQYNTYDFVLNEDVDPLEQKRLLGIFGDILCKKGLKRDSDNPDIYLYVTLHNDKNIETVYQPRQVTRTTSGTYGSSSYSYSTKGGYGNLRSNTNTTTVTEDQGTMRTYVSTDAYMQLTILDAKKINETIAPKIWQYTLDEHLDYIMKFSDYEGKIQYYGQMYPLGDDGKFIWRRYCGRDNSQAAYFWGFFLYRGKVSGIVPGSFAEKNGIKIGDSGNWIEKGEKVKNSTVLYKAGNRYSVLKSIGKVKIKASMFKDPTFTMNGDQFDGACPFIQLP